MENKNVALIACTIGYGHIRRLLILSQALKECGLTPVLFVPLLPTKIIAKKGGIVIPEIVDFDTTCKQNYYKGAITIDNEPDEDDDDGIRATDRYVSWSTIAENIGATGLLHRMSFWSFCAG